MSEWVSDWLLLNANSAIFQPYHGENKLLFNEMMMRPTRLVEFLILVLAHWNNSLRIDMSLYSDTLSWLRANQSLLLNASLVWPDWGLNLLCTSLEVSTLPITLLRRSWWAKIIELNRDTCNLYMWVLDSSFVFGTHD